MKYSKELLAYIKTLTLLFVEENIGSPHHDAEILQKLFQEVERARDNKEALQLYSKEYDILLIDIELPEMSSVELIEDIYKINSKQVIVVLYSEDASELLAPLVNIGVKYLIRKPIDYQELLTLLYDVAKELHTNASINFHQKIIFNKNITLTKFETILLDLLTTNPNKIYSNEDIVAHFENLNESIHPQNIRKLVSKIKKKMPSQCIQSIYAQGYKIV